MKMYFICSGEKDWWSCHGVLSNGFFFGQHICSHPNFSPGDLYSNRTNRKNALKELFGIDEDTVERELIVVNKREDLPIEILEADTEDRQKDLAPLYEKYDQLVGGKQESKIELTVT